MVSETLQISHLTNGGAENNHHKKRDRFTSQGYDAREEVSNGHIQLDIVSKKARQQKEMTLEDMYNNQDEFGDDDDDSDWEPSPKPVMVVKWFCTNCTMVNLDDVVHCDICGEHKDSGILREGFFASPFLPEAGFTRNGSELTERCKGGLV